jgi:hypothetical protein
MKNQSGCAKFGAILTLLLGVLGLVALCAFIFIDYSSRQQRQVRAQFAPPTVLVTDPASGESASAGSYLGVSATAMGASPIVSVELWLDGELKETQSSDQLEGVSSFYANFGLLIPSEGPHMLFVRAVNANGVIGQSLPVSLISEPKPAEVFLAVTAQEGETLEGIATAYAASPEILQELNPDLGNQPPAGTLVKVPLPPKEEPPAPPQPPASPPPGSTPVEIPNVPMLQITYVGSPGLLPSGPFLPEPFAVKAGPPIAPTGLQVEVKGCKVILRWNDNADDEENYYVYMVPVTFHGFTVPIANLKPSPSTGPAWHEFQPTAGGAVSLWVEAANSYGSKPSNIAWVYIPYVSGCSPTTAHDLDVTLLDISVAGNLEEIYCYVSIENSPEQRIPFQKDVFIPLHNGKSQIPSSDGFFVIPVPIDKSLDLSGVCIGWLGNSYYELGPFSDSLTPDTWNGERQALRWNGHEIGLSVKPRQVWLGGAIGISSTNPMLPAPYALLEEPRPEAKSDLARTLRWKWDGDPTKIDGYVIFLNGKPHTHTYSPKNPEEWVYLPGECGGQIRWQVAARTGEALSYLSEPIQYDLPPCQAYLRVRFDDIFLEKTDDGFPTPGTPCETLDAYFNISVKDVTRSFWGGNFFLPLKCGRHYFGDMTGETYKQLYGPAPNVITIPLAPDVNDNDIGGMWISAKFWDHDDNPDDLFASFYKHPAYSHIPQYGEKWPECEITYTTGASITDSARSTLTYTIAFYPNVCKDIPPADGTFR